MSYFPVEPIGHSQGINFDMFRPGVLNPMIPQDMYRPAAAGPKYLSTDGIVGDIGPVRQDISGFPTAQTPPPPQTLAVLDQLAQSIADKTWPFYQAKLDAAMQPYKWGGLIVGGLAAIAIALSIRSETRRS
jgi:hypothetical protein